jgi:hypothetical protein
VGLDTADHRMRNTDVYEEWLYSKMRRRYKGGLHQADLNKGGYFANVAPQKLMFGYRIMSRQARVWGLNFVINILFISLHLRYMFGFGVL